MPSVHLKANNGKYVCAEGGGGGLLIANRSAASDWETFELGNSHVGPIKSGDKVTLKAADGHYVCAEAGGGAPLLATRLKASDWETFEIWGLDENLRPVTEIASGCRITLRCHCGHYVCAEGGGGYALEANRPVAGSWELFTVESAEKPPARAQRSS